MTRQTNAAGIVLIARNEGLILTAYHDAVGILTIGYGHTGPDVYEGQQIDTTQAANLLKADLARFEAAVEQAVGNAPTTDDQFAAMVSLAYNIGAEAFRHSTVLREHRVSYYEAAADAFLLWDKAGGHVLPGLVRRRHEERALYLGTEVLA